jgi:hypothetical protein
MVNPKPQPQNPNKILTSKPKSANGVLDYLDLGFGICFGFWIWDFDIIDG